MAGTQIDLPACLHEAFFEVSLVGMMPNFIMHCIKGEYKQRRADFMFAIQPEQKEILGWETGRRAFFQLGWVQTLHNIAHDEMLYVRCIVSGHLNLKK